MLAKKLATEFPEYAELAATKPVPLDEVQQLLGPEEALLAYLVSEKKTYVWAVQRNKAEIFIADVVPSSLSNESLIINFSWIFIFKNT